MRLSEVLATLSDTEVSLVVRAGEGHNEYLKKRLPGWIQFVELEDLHAKAIVTPEFVYLGSANITRGGLEVNRELCEIIENEYDDVVPYLREELNFDV
jgi:phosphatidylserine/phosphatidylglycerophosphate/cardiolipin synthase-like enzyme